MLKYSRITVWVTWTEYGTMNFSLKSTLSDRPTPNARATRFCFVVVHTLCTCFPYSYGLCQLSWRIFSTLILAFFMSCNTYGNCWGFLTMVHSAVLNVWCLKPYNSLEKSLKDSKYLMKTYMSLQYALIKAWLNSSLHFFSILYFNCAN